jgi:hypothetical protein
VVGRWTVRERDWNQDFGPHDLRRICAQLAERPAETWSRSSSCWAIVRPLSDKVHFVQLDDLDAEGLKRVGEAAFLTLATSPGNHQAWVAVSDIKDEADAKDFSRRLRKGAGADKSASGATRVAGTVNYKRKYEPDFPTVRIEKAHPGLIVTKAQLEGRGLVATPEPEAVHAGTTESRRTGPSQYRPRKNKTWPNYAVSLAGAPLNRAGTGPDRSMAGFHMVHDRDRLGMERRRDGQKAPGSQRTSQGAHRA